MSDEKKKADVLADAMQHAKDLDEDAPIYICHGPPRCTFTGEGDDPPEDCKWCMVLYPDDERNAAQILAETQ